MIALLRFAILTMFLAGLGAVGVMGASTDMTFVWSGYLLIGMSGILSVVTVFQRSTFLTPHWCFAAVFAILGYFFVRAMLSPVSYFAREDGALLVMCFLSYFVFVSVFDKISRRKALFRCLLGLIAINLLVGAIQLAGGGQFRLLPSQEGGDADAIVGLFQHSDHFAGLMALGAPLILASAVFGNRRRISRWTLGLFAALALLSIVPAKSLLGFLAALVGISVLGIFLVCLSWNQMGARSKKLLVWSVAFGMILAAGFVSLNAERVEKVVAGNILLRDGRPALAHAWNSGMQQFLESPLTGTGSRTSYFFSRKFQPEADGAAVSESKFIHNEYLQVLADYGVIGLLLVVTLLVVHFRNGLRFIFGYIRFPVDRGSLFPRSDYLGLVAGSVAALAALGFLSVFEFVMHLPIMALIATMLLGFLACPDPMSRPVEPGEDEAYLPGGAFLFAGRSFAFGAGIVLAFFSVIFGRSEWHYEMAEIAYSAGVIDSGQLRHLRAAREIDPSNPYARSLSALSYAKAITPEMSDPVRTAYLSRADRHFTEARVLYPQDIHSAIAHSVILDQLGRTYDAGQRLASARAWAPENGELLRAEADLIARSESLQLAGVEERNLAGKPGPANDDAKIRTLPEAEIREVEFGGAARSSAGDTAVTGGETSPDAVMVAPVETAETVPGDESAPESEEELVTEIREPEQPAWRIEPIFLPQVVMMPQALPVPNDNF